MAISTQTTLQGSTISAANGLTLQAAKITGNSFTAQAGSINGQTVDPNATLNIDAAVNDQSQSTQSSGHNLMTQSTSGSGKIAQTLQYTTIAVPDAKAANGAVKLNATGGITVGALGLQSGSATSAGAGSGNVPTITVDLRQQALQLAQQPGLGYMAQLAGRNDVNWQKVQLAAQNWNYSQQGLTGAAAIIAIVVAVVTYGAASGLSASIASGAGMTTTAGAAGASAVAVTGAGVADGTVLTTTGAAFSGAMAAGMTAMASEAAVSLANNGGDIGATLKQLGSSQSMRSIATAMLTAGMIQEVSGAFDLGPVNGAS